MCMRWYDVTLQDLLLSPPVGVDRNARSLVKQFAIGYDHDFFLSFSHLP